MSKSKAEIQREYRRIKKQNDPDYLIKERERQKKYRVSASDKPKAQRESDNIRARTYNNRYRRNLRKRNTKTKHNDVTRNQINERDESDQCTQHSVISSTNNEDGTSMSTRSSTPKGKLTVKMNFTGRRRTSTKRSKALRSARSGMMKMRNKLSSSQKDTEKWRKRYERLHRKTVISNKDKRKQMKSEQIEDSIRIESETRVDPPSTPRSKTNLELRQMGISPNLFQNQFLRK